jgi:hypothetical protein
VLYPTVNSDSRIPTARVVGTSDGSMLGAHVPGRVVLFGRDGPVKTAIDYRAGALRKPTRHVLVDMRPGAAYQVTINRAAPEIATASGAGVLTFETRDTDVTVGVRPVQKVETRGSVSPQRRRAVPPSKGKRNTKKWPSRQKGR